MRYSWLVLVCVLFVGCGKNRPAPGAWPATVVSQSNFSEEQWKDVTNAIEFLNEGANSNLVSLDTSAEGYPIHFKLVPISTENRKRAGYAIVSSDECTIELTETIFRSNNKDLIIPVVDHELGHCAGLDHTSGEGDIMSPTAVKLNEYSSEAIDRFFTSIRASVGF